jgi:hypothetical protein
VIHHVDKALESLLRQEVPLPEASVDLSFRPPEASWTASVSKPTVNVFLWDIAKAKRSDSSGLDERVVENGRRQHRPPPAQVVLRYYVTVWTREQRDEHELLGAILRCVLANETMPATVLPDALAETPCRVILGGDEQRLPAALWGGAPAKPGIYVEMELGVEAFDWIDRGAPIESVQVGVTDKDAVADLPAGPKLDEPPPLRRRRSGGALVMEGRPQPPADPADAADEDGRP